MTPIGIEFRGSQTRTDKCFWVRIAIPLEIKKA